MKKPKKPRLTAAQKRRYLAAGEAPLAMAEKDVPFKLRLKILVDRNVKDEDDRALMRECGLLD